MSSTGKRIKKIQREAQKAAISCGYTLYETEVFVNNDGYLFSWILGTGALFIGIPREAVHVGFALTPYQIDEHYETMNHQWFKELFKQEMTNHILSTPEETLNRFLDTNDNIPKDVQVPLTDVITNDTIDSYEAPQETT